MVRPRIGQRPGQDTSYLHPGAADLEHGAFETGLRDGDLDIGAGTAWLWAREQFQASVDTLFIDEAGQMSLANILAVAGAARNLVLIGDPQQLAQPSQAAHPPGAGASASSTSSATTPTAPRTRGVLLDETWRTHLGCRFTSETSMTGKLSYAKGLERQEILGGAAAPGFDTGGGGYAPGEHERIAGGGCRGGAACAGADGAANGKTRTGRGGRLGRTTCSW